MTIFHILAPDEYLVLEISVCSYKIISYRLIWLTVENNELYLFTI